MYTGLYPPKREEITRPMQKSHWFWDFPETFCFSKMLYLVLDRSPRSCHIAVTFRWCRCTPPPLTSGCVFSLSASELMGSDRGVESAWEEYSRIELKLDDDRVVSV